MKDIKELLPYVKLRFNLEHPSFEECYSFGYQCAEAELDESENPFKLGSKESDIWLEGWWDGFYGESPSFSLEGAWEPSLLAERAANDEDYHKTHDGFWAKLIEVTGVLAVTALIGYQVIDLVA